MRSSGVRGALYRHIAPPPGAAPPGPLPSHYQDDLRPDNHWTPHRAVFQTQLTKMAEELGDEDLVDYEEDEVVDDKPADEVKK